MKIEVNSAEDQQLFQQAMKDDPDLRAALMDAMRSGMQPAQAIAALVSEAKGAVGDAAGVAQPKLLSAAIEQYVGTRKVLSKNRRSTAGEKERTLELLLQHLESQGKDLARVLVHDLKRSNLVDFVAAYASVKARTTFARSRTTRTRVAKPRRQLRLTRPPKCRVFHHGPS